MKNCKKILAMTLILVLALAAIAPAAFAADYPTKGITLILTELS